eukprot:SAG31_NODE_1397_length_8506_cov_13.069585_2_plen_120_part_00
MLAVPQVFCPAITDGSVGDMLFFHSYKHDPPLIVDIARDIRAINDIAMAANKSGMLILGGGLCKHHTCNANLMRNGADYSVFINTGQEFDSSDSGVSSQLLLTNPRVLKVLSARVFIHC